MKNKSCEVNYYRYNLIVISIASLFIIFPGLIILTLPDGLGVFLVLFIIWGIIFLPFIIYFSYRYNYFSKLEPLYIQEVVLERAEGSYSRLVRFSFELNIGGVKKQVRTLAVFNTSIFGPNLIQDFSGKRALVGYDEKNNVAVVIKALE